MSQIRAVTFNVHRAEPTRAVRAVFRELDQERRRNLYLLQEVKARTGLVDMLREDFALGVVHVEPEFAVAFDRERFEHIRHRRILMSPVRYWTINYALLVILRDNATGRRLKVVSYHPPAHVQVPKHPTFPKVSRVLRDWDDRIDTLARRSRTAVLAGGDLNVDTGKGWHPRGGWGWLTDGPLDQVRAPRPTHGKRRIDDFRHNRALRPVGGGWVLNTNVSDHRPFGQNFAYND